MKRSLLGIFVVLLYTAVSLTSCGESKKEREQRERIDSLENANLRKELDYDDLQKYLAVIAEGLDSIAIEEKEILVNNVSESPGLNRQLMKNNLAHVREILARHRDRIKELEAKLANSQGDASHLRTIITALREQLDAKDRELEQLKADLEDNRKSIKDLTSRVQRMSEEQEQQEQTIREQQETIQQQADQMNMGYIKIASKKELKNEGLLTGGLMKKKVDYSQIDLSQFQQIDIRTTTRIDLPAKAKILTAVPNGSYTLTTTASGTVLEIRNPASFWSVSNFLIIQTD
ncbi:MAG: hypothetical protein J1E02_03905 [Coprobacter sp.]|nr:hypothetical protein [Coprobacter sp.]